MQGNGECGEAAGERRADGQGPARTTHKAASWDGSARSRGGGVAEEAGGADEAAADLGGGVGGALGRGGAIVRSIFPTIRSRIPVFSRAAAPGENQGGSRDGESAHSESGQPVIVERGQCLQPPRAPPRPSGSARGDKARADHAPEGASAPSAKPAAQAIGKEKTRLLPPGGPETPTHHRGESSRTASGGSHRQAAAPAPSFMEFLDKMEEDCSRQMPALKLACRRLNESLELSMAAPASAQSAAILKLFQGADLPCSPERYVLRMVKYGETSVCNVVVALIYLTRARAAHPELTLTPTNAQRLLLVAVMTATKFLDDEHYSNKYWAKIGELTLQEMNKLELAFLTLLDMSCQVNRAEYDSFVETMGQRDYAFLCPNTSLRLTRRSPACPSLSPVSSVYDFPDAARKDVPVSPLFRTTSLDL